MTERRFDIQKGLIGLQGEVLYNTALSEWARLDCSGQDKVSKSEAARRFLAAGESLFALRRIRGYLRRVGIAPIGDVWIGIAEEISLKLAKHLLHGEPEDSLQSILNLVDARLGFVAPHSRYNQVISLTGIARIIQDPYGNDVYEFLRRDGNGNNALVVAPLSSGTLQAGVLITLLKDDGINVDLEAVDVTDIRILPVRSARLRRQADLVVAFDDVDGETLSKVQQYVDKTYYHS